MIKLGRSLVFALVVLLLLSGVVIADYLINTVVGNVAVNETIVVANPTSFTMNLCPNDVKVHNMVVRNFGSTTVEVSADAAVAPSGGGVTVELGMLTVVEPYTAVTVPVSVIAANDVVPGVYTVTVTVER